MPEYQPWDDSWREQLVYITLPYGVEAPVEMPANFSYPIFLGAFEKKVGGEEFWKAVAGSMIYILGHQPDHCDASLYIYWLNHFNHNIAKELVSDGAEQTFRENPETAIWLLQAAVLLDTDSIEAHYNLGLAYNKLGLYLNDKNNQEEAKSCFKQAARYLENVVELDAGYSLAYYNLGFVYKNLGRQDESQKYFEKGILLGVDSLSPHGQENHSHNE